VLAPQQYACPVGVRPQLWRAPEVKEEIIERLRE